MKAAKTFLFVVGLAVTATAQSVSTFWNDYPDCERQCHQTVYGNQSCTLQNNCACAGCLCLADSCLCETSSWLVAVTQCIGEQCGASAVSDAAGIASSACAGNGYPLVVSEQSLIADGLAAIPSTTAGQTTLTSAAQIQSTTSPQVTHSSESSPPSITNSLVSQSTSSTSLVASTGGHGSLSTALIAIIAVLATILVGLSVGGYFLWRHKQNKKKKGLDSLRNPRDGNARSHAGDPLYAKTSIDNSTVQNWRNNVGDDVELQDRSGIPPSVTNVSGSTR